MPTFDVSLGGQHRFRLQATNEQYALHEAALRLGYVDADDMREKAPGKLAELQDAAAKARSAAWQFAVRLRLNQERDALLASARAPAGIVAQEEC